jgi:CubicO group peptidase (beta-lactamase class C family)
MVNTKGGDMRISNVNSKKIISLFLIFSLFAFFAKNSVYAQPKQREYWPTSSWKYSTPEMQGMDSANLLIAVEFIQNRLPDAYSLLVVKNGYLVFEKYFRYGSPERVATIHSITKSVMSALIGIAREKGYVKSVDQRLIEFFPEYFTAQMDPRKKEISLKHLLTMTTGLQWDDWGSIVWAWINSPDRLKFTIQLPLRDTPGEVFEYNTSASHLLSGILTKTSKMTTLDFANQHLFGPLGIWVPDFANQPRLTALELPVN